MMNFCSLRQFEKLDFNLQSLVNMKINVPVRQSKNLYYLGEFVVFMNYVLRV